MRQGTVDVSYVGEELRSGDWETFAYILRFAAAVPLGQRLPLIRVVEMLKAMGRGTSTPDRKHLARQLQRLRNAELRVWTNDVAIVESWKALFPNEPLFKRGDIPGVRTSCKLLGDLVEAKTEKGNTVEFTTELSRYVRAFFGQKLSSWYSESMYQRLTGDLAKRLFLFYQSHDGRFDFTFDELVEYLGASTDREQFRRSLRQAHDKLTEACFLKGWSLKDSARRNGQMAYVLQGLTIGKRDQGRRQRIRPQLSTKRPHATLTVGATYGNYHEQTDGSGKDISRDVCFFSVRPSALASRWRRHQKHRRCPLHYAMQ